MKEIDVSTLSDDEFFEILLELLIQQCVVLGPKAWMESPLLSVKVPFPPEMAKLIAKVSHGTKNKEELFDATVTTIIANLILKGLSGTARDYANGKREIIKFKGGKND